MSYSSNVRPIKVAAAGDEAIIPQHILAELRAAPGEWLQVVRTTDGLLISFDPLFSDAMRAADKMMIENFEALKALAK